MKPDYSGIAPNGKSWEIYFDATSDGKARISWESEHRGQMKHQYVPEWLMDEFGMKWHMEAKDV